MPGWYWNALIARRSVPKQMQALLGSGTAANQSFHAEMNGWYRNQPELYPTTLQTQLQVASVRRYLLVV